MRIFISILLLTCLCFPQTKKTFTKDTVTLCWSELSNEQNVKYVLYYRKHNTVNWIKILDTNVVECKVKRPEYGEIDFGVTYVLNNDTSEIHCSLDSTACLDAECSNDCSVSGGWYVKFSLDKPSGIRIISK